MSDKAKPADPGKLTAFVIGDAPLIIRPAPLEREWMNATHERFAYRCLPLNIANAHGWELLSPAGFTAGWTGKPGTDAVVIGPDAGTTAPAVSHFGHGILTFHIPALFRTEPGYDLMIQGPINRPKDGLYALSGVVETDWMPFSFTMNWVFTRPGALLRFEKDEPGQAGRGRVAAPGGAEPVGRPLAQGRVRGMVGQPQHLQQRPQDPRLRRPGREVAEDLRPRHD